MLLRFEAGNHRSIMDPIELTMIAVDADRPAARTVGNIPERVLTVAGIYGANASGKSNVLDALAWLSAAVRGSVAIWNEIIPHEPFMFGSGHAGPSTFEVDMVVCGVRHTYNLILDRKAVRFEALYSYPERRPRMLFKREGEDIQFRRGFSGAAGTRELLTPTTLALSAAMRFPESEARDFGRAIGSIAEIRLRHQSPWRVRTPPLIDEWNTMEIFQDLPAADRITTKDCPTSELVNLRIAAIGLLQYAELGIDDVRVSQRKEQWPRPGDDPFTLIMKKAKFRHTVAGQSAVFGDNQESQGTMTWFNLIGPLLHALRNGRILLFDELDASLHPRLSARIIELFQDPMTNPNDAQLIFTSHDTSLLNHLNRDEVWLTEKNEDGATALTALAEYGGDKVRRSLNIEKAYLQGRFGAVPEFDQVRLRRALGLAADDR